MGSLSILSLALIILGVAQIINGCVVIWLIRKVG